MTMLQKKSHYTNEGIQDRITFTKSAKSFTPSLCSSGLRLRILLSFNSRANSLPLPITEAIDTFLHVCIIIHAGNRSRRTIFVSVRTGRKYPLIMQIALESDLMRKKFRIIWICMIYRGSPFIESSLVRAIRPQQ